MRITAVSAGIGLLALGFIVLMLACAYLVGYWNVLGESWHAMVTLDRLFSLPMKVGFGFVVVATVFAVIAHRLKGYACGQKMNIFGLLLFALSMLAAMYIAIYDAFTLMDVYPFVGLLVISLLLFRFEDRVVAAVLVGSIVLGFYILGAKELGERDGERSLLKQSEYVTPVVAHK